MPEATYSRVALVLHYTPRVHTREDVAILLVMEMSSDGDRSTGKAREMLLTEFARRNSFKVFKHGHGACFGASGVLAGLDLTMADGLDDLEL